MKNAFAFYGAHYTGLLHVKSERIVSENKLTCNPILEKLRAQTSAFLRSTVFSNLIQRLGFIKITKLRKFFYLRLQVKGQRSKVLTPPNRACIKTGPGLSFF
jgi:hypothetical protein